MESIKGELNAKLPKNSNIDIDNLLHIMEKKLSPLEFDLKIYDILIALSDLDNHEIIVPLLKDVDKLLSCDTIDLYPKINYPIRESVEKRDSNKKTEYENLCMDYTCRNCKKNKTITSFIHRRCLDEAGDMKIQCINCNTIWYK